MQMNKCVCMRLIRVNKQLLKQAILDIIYGALLGFVIFSIMLFSFYLGHYKEFKVDKPSYPIGTYKTIEGGKEIIEKTNKR